MPSIVAISCADVIFVAKTETKMRDKNNFFITFLFFVPIKLPNFGVNFGLYDKNVREIF